VTYDAWKASAPEHAHDPDSVTACELCEEPICDYCEGRRDWCVLCTDAVARCDLCDEPNERDELDARGYCQPCAEANP
jgi:hypothetical protein